MPIPQALKSEAAQAAIRAILGGTAGAALGRYGTPKAFGYEDNPAAVNMSTMLDAVMFGAAAGLGRKGWQRLAQSKGALMAPQIAGAVAGSELVPVGMNLLTKSTDAAKAVATKPTASEQFTTALTSPTARGIGTGAAVAGLGSILTGLMRPRRDSERRHGTSRIGMVKNDLLTYIIPAMVAGGVIGYTRGNKPNQP